MTIDLSTRSLRFAIGTAVVVSVFLAGTYLGAAACMAWSWLT